MAWSGGPLGYLAEQVKGRVGDIARSLRTEPILRLERACVVARIAMAFLLLSLNAVNAQTVTGAPGSDAPGAPPAVDASMALPAAPAPSPAGEDLLGGTTVTVSLAEPVLS